MISLQLYDNMQQTLTFFKHYFVDHERQVREYCFETEVDHLEKIKTFADLERDRNITEESVEPPEDFDKAYFPHMIEGPFKISFEEACELCEELIIYDAPRQPSLPPGVWEVSTKHVNGTLG